MGSRWSKSCLGPGNSPQAQRRGERVCCHSSCPTLSSRPALQAALGRPGHRCCAGGHECVCREGDVPFTQEQHSSAGGSITEGLEAPILSFRNTALLSCALSRCARRLRFTARPFHTSSSERGALAHVHVCVSIGSEAVGQG